MEQFNVGWEHPKGFLVEAEGARDRTPTLDRRCASASCACPKNCKGLNGVMCRHRKALRPERGDNAA